MKQHHLSSRFLTFYICIGIFGFFLITLGGSYMVEKYFESAQSTTLYEDVCSIASSDLLKEQLSELKARNKRIMNAFPALKGEKLSQRIKKKINKK